MNAPKSLPPGKPVLFFDIDGVMNAVGEDTETILGDPEGNKGVHPAKVEQFRRVVERADAWLVIVSRWRDDPRAMYYFWHRVGHDMERRCLGATPVLDEQLSSGLFRAVIRGDEVQAYLDEHPEIEHFVIVDDGEEYGPLIDRVIRTHPLEGLTPEVADRIIHRLMNR